MIGNLLNEFLFLVIGKTYTDQFPLIIREFIGNKIYDRFYRVDKSHSREIGGTGLGLAITRNAILLHRGAIKASSIVGEGTTFTVRIPLRKDI